jgi:Rrf2 family protein
MNFLARKTDYAVRALIYMAGKVPERVSTAELHRDLGLPRPFMRGVLQNLQKAGYLESVKGQGGGFVLNVKPESIRLNDLFVLFQGPVSMGDCLFRKKLCVCAQTCPLRREIKEIEVFARERLQNATVASLMKGLQQGEKR